MRVCNPKFILGLSGNNPSVGSPTKTLLRFVKIERGCKRSKLLIKFRKKRYENLKWEKHFFVCLFVSNGGSLSSSSLAILLRREQNPNSRVLNAGSGKPFYDCPLKNKEQRF